MWETTASLFVPYIIAFCLGATEHDANKLFEEKVYPLNPRLMPIKNQSAVLTVSFKLHLTAITSFDELLQKFSTTSWLEIKWLDELIAWNASDYGGIQRIFPDPDDLWRPALAALHSFEETKPVGQDFVLISVINTGEVTWMPGSKLETFCRVNIQKYPFDSQECLLNFFNWGTTEEELMLTTYDEGIDLSGFYDNGEWDLVKTSVRDYTVIFKDGKLKAPHVEMTIRIKRRSSIIVLTVLLPVMLLSFINVCAFVIPAGSGEKLSFAITVLLALAVFLTFINSMMPQTSESTSYLALYITGQLIISSLTVFLASVSLGIYFRQTSSIPTKFERILTCLVPEKEDHPKCIVKNDDITIFQTISKRLDYICFWLFFSLTIVMLSAFFLALFY